MVDSCSMSPFRVFAKVRTSAKTAGKISKYGVFNVISPAAVALAKHPRIDALAATVSPEKVTKRRRILFDSTGGVRDCIFVAGGRAAPSRVVYEYAWLASVKDM